VHGSGQKAGFPGFANYVLLPGEERGEEGKRRGKREKKKRRKGGEQDRKRGKERRKGGAGQGKKEREKKVPFLSIDIQGYTSHVCCAHA
jgi:hypothetical protein